MASRPRSLAQIGEHGFLAQLLPTLPQAATVLVGPGDDCAVIRLGRQRYVLTTDALVEGVHFHRDWLTPFQLGRKAYLVNASDVAAMGGQPRYAVVSVCVPTRYAAADLLALHRGIAAAAAETGASVVGGNVARSRVLTVSITLLGVCEHRPLLRSGARVGDHLFVTGELGAAALGLRQLRKNVRARGPWVQRFRSPPVRLQAGALLARHRLASAMIDVSDGLLQDLGHLCAQSGVGARVEAVALPCTAPARARGYALALGGGEDYELMCSVPSHRLARMRELQHKFGCRLTRIGRIVHEKNGVRVVDTDGEPIAVSSSGFDHFRMG